LSYIIIHKERGIFAALGESLNGYNTQLLFTLDEQDEEHPFIIKQTTKFSSEEVASEFLKEVLRPKEIEKCKIFELKVENESNKFASYQEILKSGYNEWAGNMIHSVPMISTAMH